MQIHNINTWVRDSGCDLIKPTKAVAPKGGKRGAPATCNTCSRPYLLWGRKNGSTCPKCIVNARRNRLRAKDIQCCPVYGCKAHPVSGSSFCPKHRRGKHESTLMVPCVRCGTHYRNISPSYAVDAYCIDCGKDKRALHNPKGRV